MYHKSIVEIPGYKGKIGGRIADTGAWLAFNISFKALKP
jgi:hypothetical protein